MASPTSKLTIKNFAHIGELSLEFGDLTVLVGAQGTGKSLALQWLKVALDGRRVVARLKEAGHTLKDDAQIVESIFGQGMGSAWHQNSEIRWNSTAVVPSSLKNGRAPTNEKVFFVPAHRSLLISDGWAATFNALNVETPVVARIFSQHLHDRFRARGGETLFPLKNVLKKQYRDLIDAAVFHGGTVGLQEAQQRKRLEMTHGDTHLPFLTWTAGQREFTPLLLGLYALLPQSGTAKNADVDWVVIEEPEMGLHPEAINAFLVLTLDLLWRGYRVVLSTHSPHVLAAMWMLRLLVEHHANPDILCDAFKLGKSKDMKAVAQSAMMKGYRTHFLSIGANAKVSAKDISTLDAGAADEEISGWGGLSGLSSRFSDAVAKAVNEDDSL